MSNISREELDAKLSRNKAESESIAAAMTTEMAQFRTSYVESFSEISKTLSRIESKADATEKRLTQAQWIISAVIALCALTISISLNIAGRNNTHIAPQPAASPITINTGETKPPTVVDASPKRQTNSKYSNTRPPRRVFVPVTRDIDLPINNSKCLIISVKI